MCDDERECCDSVKWYYGTADTPKDMLILLCGRFYLNEKHFSSFYVLHNISIKDRVLPDLFIK